MPRSTLWRKTQKQEQCALSRGISTITDSWLAHMRRVLRSRSITMMTRRNKYFWKARLHMEMRYGNWLQITKIRTNFSLFRVLNRGFIKFCWMIHKIIWPKRIWNKLTILMKMQNHKLFIRRCKIKMKNCLWKLCMILGIIVQMCTQYFLMKLQVIRF